MSTGAVDFRPRIRLPVKKVTTREQAIAIGLSEARKAGGKVPTPPE